MNDLHSPGESPRQLPHQIASLPPTSGPAAKVPVAPQPGAGLSPPQRRSLLHLARSSIEAAVHQLSPPRPNPDALEPPFLEPRACFVTIEKHLQLRGCIGHLIPLKPLYEAVMDAARQAAVGDPRFARVQPEELADITLEISLLSRILPLSYHSPAELLDQLEPFQHGVVLEFEDRTSTFLPQVWEQIPDKTTFLERLALKGGWDPATWRDARARVSIYEVECFHEPAVSL